MRLGSHWHLAYCTNIHRGETWSEILAGLERHTLAVRDRVAPRSPYAIGLRLGATAARELSDPARLAAFRKWLDRHDCYVFTINGFPYGRFHGTRVKEQVYAPDWTTSARLTYTRQLFEILAALLPPDVPGSVSTVPGSFKEFIRSPSQTARMRANLWSCVEFLAELERRTGRELHLGLEPEPLCHLETTTETARFFEAMRAERPGDDRLDRHLGVNYDACHLAVEFEDAAAALDQLHRHRIRLSKVHLSNALRLPARRAATALGARSHPGWATHGRHPLGSRSRPVAQGSATLAFRLFSENRTICALVTSKSGVLEDFRDEVYFHQVVARDERGNLRRFRDLEVALADLGRRRPDRNEEWRVHYHVPLHCQPAAPFQTTADHLAAVLDVLATHPERCRHFEMETYTWEVLPPALKSRDVVDQLVAEYRWTLDALAARGVRPPSAT